MHYSIIHTFIHNPLMAIGNYSCQLNICCPRDCVSRHNGGNLGCTIDSEGFKGGTRGSPIMPRDLSLSDSKCWNGGYKWVNETVPEEGRSWMRLHGFGDGFLRGFGDGFLHGFGDEAFRRRFRSEERSRPHDCSIFSLKFIMTTNGIAQTQYCSCIKYINMFLL